MVWIADLRFVLTPGKKQGWDNVIKHYFPL